MTTDLARAAFALAAAAACSPAVAPPPSAPEHRPAEPAHSAAQLDGEVLGVDRVPPGDQLASGVRVRLQTSASSPVVVDLAPDWYLDRQGLRFGRTERVSVEGVRQGSSVVYATRVTKDGRTIELRDPKTGKPLWTAPGR